MNENPRILVRTLRRSRQGKLALQTAILHLGCSVACIIIGVFSMAIIKSETIQRIYGLPLWIGLLLLLTGFAGIQCHVKKTKVYAGLYMVLSLLSMFFNLIGIAWILSSRKSLEVVVICLICIATFDMGIACLSTAMGCNLLMQDCKVCKHHRRAQSAQDSSTDRRRSGRSSRSADQDRDVSQETIHLTADLAGHLRYAQPLHGPGDEPPPYSAIAGPPPPYSDS